MAGGGGGGIGRGQTSLRYFFGLMDMLPPLMPRAYNEHLRHLAEVAMECASENMRAASNHLHELSGVSYDDDILDVCVTCDGTWSKRGYTATYGIVVVIAWETGQVLDFQIHSKRCTVCSKKLTSTKWEEDSEEFKSWYKTHEGACQKNHEGSSGAMEVMAALEIWKRSEERLHLRFTEVISDGDAKTVTKLQESKPYGEDVTITKYECVGHGVGKGLRGVKKQVLAANRQVRPGVKKLRAEKKLKEKKLKSYEKNLATKVKEREKMDKEREKRERGKGKGKARGKRKSSMPDVDEEEDVAGLLLDEDIEDMEGDVQYWMEEVKEVAAKLAAEEEKMVGPAFSDPNIDKLQTYYENAIRGNVGDLEGMKKACWAVYYHSVSTDDKPQHQYCPTGADSWCEYQRAQHQCAEAEKRSDVPPPWSYKHAPRIPVEYDDLVKPVFDRLCREELLEKCPRGATQNRNESFNKLIWARAPNFFSHYTDCGQPCHHSFQQWC